MRRRNFINFLTRGFAALGLVSPLTLRAMPNEKKKVGFVHQVFFWLENPDSESDQRTFEKNLFTFLEACDSIVEYYVGTPAQTPREVVDNSYTYNLIVHFVDREAHDVYQEHEAHVKFIEDTKALWTRVQVYDSIASTR